MERIDKQIARVTSWAPVGAKICRDRYKFVISGSHDHKYCCLGTWPGHVTRDSDCLSSRGQRPPAVSSLRHPRLVFVDNIEMMRPGTWERGGILWQFHTLEPKLTPGQYWSSQCWTVDYWSDMARDINWNIDCVICWQATIVTHESHWHNSDHDPGELYPGNRQRVQWMPRVMCSCCGQMKQIKRKSEICIDELFWWLRQTLSLLFHDCNLEQIKSALTCPASDIM